IHEARGPGPAVQLVQRLVVGDDSLAQEREPELPALHQLLEPRERRVTHRHAGGMARRVERHGGKRLRQRLEELHRGRGAHMMTRGTVGAGWASGSACREGGETALRMSGTLLFL